MDSGISWKITGYSAKQKQMINASAALASGKMTQYNVQYLPLFLLVSATQQIPSGTASGEGRKQTGLNMRWVPIRAEHEVGTH